MIPPSAARLVPATLLALPLTLLTMSAAATPAYQQAHLPIEERIADLLGRMTLTEKIDQLHQSGVGDANPNNLQTYGDPFQPTFGSFIIGGPWQTVLPARNAFQRRIMTESRLGIPAIFGSDIIHGYRTITPIPLAQACSWNPELITRGCAMSAAEAKAHGVDWTFAPMVDHCVDPRWGRIAETFGESPYVSSVFSAASVRGFQGERLTDPHSIAACLKHYVGYGASEGGRDYVYTAIPPQALWEMHLPPFEAGVRAGARTVMSAFNDLNGTPTSAHAYTLTEILRQRWNFTGTVVSDWAAVAQLMNQGFAADGAEATERALLAGVDLDMADGLYRRHLADLVAAGRVQVATIDEAVRRVLRLKFEVGLFEKPYADATVLTAPATLDAQNLALAEELAARSLVLLKNTGVLPLAASAQRIALVGPIADYSAPLLGCWAQQGQPAETQSIAAALRERLPAGSTLTVAPGCSIRGSADDNFAPAIAAARDADVVIVCVGEEQFMSGENASRTTLRLAGRQEALVEAIATTGKPVVLVVVSGRPLDLHAFEEQMSAIVAAWAGGSRAAAALADTLLGRRNPSGRLAVTWPRTTGQIPLYHNMRPRARTGNDGIYQDFPTTPLYEFAHGLSYTTFSYSPITLSAPELSVKGTLTAEVTVTNTGARAGIETVFWFIRDPAASITRPLKELKFFEQAELAPGESRTFRFVIDPLRDLSFPDADGRRILERGAIHLTAGTAQTSFNVVN